MTLKLIVGLGNPGEEYAATRHNVGFAVVDALAKAYSSSNWQTKFGSHVSKIKVATSELLIAKPMCYMNCSGPAVLEIMRFFKLQPYDVLIIHDDLDLVCGRIKIKVGGGSGGHNGIKSLDGVIGKEYSRLRLGISRPGFGGDIAKYVLSNFTKDQSFEISVAIDHIVRNAAHIISKRYDDIMNLRVLQTDFF